MKNCLAVILFVLSSSSVLASNAWYTGKVLSINTLGSDGSFQISLDNQAIKNGCLYGVVSFKVSDMGLERTKSAFSLALTAFATGRDWGVVIDMPITEQVCSASSTAGQGASIK